MGFLAEIVADVRRDVAAGRYASREGAPPAAPRGGLSTAILGRRRTGALVVEFKRVSPGSTPPRLPARTIPGFLAATNVPALAGYSALVTRPRFDGSVDDVLALVAGTDRPVLFKDFVVDPAQVDCAARVGASAVLLIARLEVAGLLAVPLVDLARRARDLGLEVLLELHARSELRLVKDVAPEMIGVNVRDLDTLRMEPARAAETLRAATGLHPLLGLSGVESPEDARRLWGLGVDGILVGSAVARAQDPGAFLCSLARAEEGP